MARGDSSRLYQSLVYRHQVAQQVGADADGRVGPGLFTVYAILASGHTTKEAEKLLIDTERTVTEIAMDTGYASTSYFIKQFRRLCGNSPMQYRKRLLQHFPAHRYPKLRAL